VEPEARTPLLKTPPAITAMPLSRQSGNSSSAPLVSSSVYRPARRKQSKSPARANRQSGAAWFMPTPIALTVPSARRRSSARYAPSIASA